MADELFEPATNKGHTIMFLIRMAFWLVIIIMLLPTNRDQQSEIVGTAEATVKDVSSFCVRNPNVCDKGQDAFQVFMEKAQFGYQMLSGLIQNRPETQLASDNGQPLAMDPVDMHQGLPGPAHTQMNQQPVTFQGSSENTLKPADLQPAWRAPSGT